MTIENTAKLSCKFRISIPKSVRSARRWHAGQVFAFIPKGSGLLLMPVPELDELAGMTSGTVADSYRDRTSRV